MANLFKLGVAASSTLNNPPVGDFYEYYDIDTLDGLGNPSLTVRDDSGTDSYYTSGVIPTELNDLTDVNILGLSDNEILVSSGGVFQNRPQPVFGTELNTFSDDSLNTNTSNVVELSVISANTSLLPIGSYIIMISANVSYDATNSDGIVNFTFDGNPVSSTTGNNEIYRLEFKEAGGNNPPGAGTNQKDTLSVSRVINVTSPGVKPLNLSIISEANGVEMNMWNASIILYRIS